MELWIRSQDRERLTKVNDIQMYYAKSDDLYVIEDCDDLGIYNTKERALEVLDDIQALLKSKVLLNTGKILGSFEDTIYKEPDKVEIQELNIIVYEMPKE